MSLVDFSLPLFYEDGAGQFIYGSLVSGPLFVTKVFSLSLHRDGPDQSSPQIGQFSGNTALESVYSTSNIILIKFHSDFSGAGFFVLSYHGKIVLTLPKFSL